LNSIMENALDCLSRDMLVKFQHLIFMTLCWNW
jgi:hypothetical protein